MGFGRPKGYTAIGDCEKCDYQGWLDSYGWCSKCSAEAYWQAQVGLELLGHYLLKVSLFQRYLAEHGIAA